MTQLPPHTLPPEGGQTAPQSPETAPLLSGGDVSRRLALGLGLGVAGAAALPLTLTTSPAEAQGLDTSAHIVIAGAGAAGISVASRLRRALRGARITIIDAKEIHNYQPGYTLVANGAWDMNKTVDRNENILPSGVTWIKAMVAEFDPDANTVTTTAGERVSYDYLVVCSGLQLDYDKIEGMSTDLIGQHGIGSVYAGHEAARKTYEVGQSFVENGGVGVFTIADTPIKCAGAPIKMTFMMLSRLESAGTRGRAEMIYKPTGRALFGVPAVHDFIVQRFGEQNCAIDPIQVLTAIDPGRKEATFLTAEGPTTQPYDYIHVVPPMSAPDALKNSPLPWQHGGMQAGGWLELNRDTLQHPRYANVFGVGDVAGVPRGKTAASVKMQVPVAVGNLLRVIAGQEPNLSYNGYTSCPLITAIGKAMLVEFDYDGQLIPSFSFIDPLTEHWSVWLMKYKLLKPAYYAMMRGNV